MTVEQRISDFKAAVDALEQATKEQFAAATLGALILRDKVALALSKDSEVAAPSSLDLLTKTDRRLTDLAVRVDAAIEHETFGDWRHSVNPDESAWWWKLDDLANAKQSWLKRLSTLIAILLVTASVAVFADTFNILRSIGANPVSTIGVLVQGALAFIAASAFTEAGRKWLIEKFSRFGKRTFTGWARTGLALLVFGITLTFWFIVPTGAAWYFHWSGNKYYREGLFERAAISYQQASSLKPYVISHHAALAKAEEKSTDYGKAVAEYKSMVALYERPGTALDDAYFFAKCDLVRLLISQDKNYPLAEKTIQDLQPKIGQVSEPNRRMIQYYLQTYHAWIELERKQLGTAKRELEFVLDKIHDGPSARYLLALVLEALPQDKEATAHLKEAKAHLVEFLRLLQQPQPDEIPLDWISYAQERTLNS